MTVYSHPSMPAIESKMFINFLEWFIIRYMLNTPRIVAVPLFQYVGTSPLIQDVGSPFLQSHYYAHNHLQLHHPMKHSTGSYYHSQSFQPPNFPLYVPLAYPVQSIKLVGR